MPARTVCTELGGLLRLSWPLVAANLAQVLMGVAGTALAGRLGVTSLAAFALGNAVFGALSIAGTGVVLGVDPHVARAVGAGDLHDAGHLFRQSVYLALATALVAVIGLLASPRALAAMGQDGAVLAEMEGYLSVLAAGMPAVLLLYAQRAFVAAMGRPGIVLLATVVANVAFVPLALWLADGGLGLPALGLPGIAVAMTACRVLMVLTVGLFIRRSDCFLPTRRPPEAPVLGSLVRLARTGLPLGVQYGIEVAAFSLTTMLVGLLGALPLAAHQVALSVASVTFQVPFAVSAAAAMRVGHAIGRRDEPGLRAAGWSAFGVALGLGLAFSVGLLGGRHAIVGWYLGDAQPEVASLAASLLAIAVAFQLADGAQAVGFGVLRGMDDTRVPVFFNLLGFGVLGLPFGALSAFTLGLGAHGLWWGLTIGLSVVSVLNWRRFARNLRSRDRPVEAGS